MVTYDKLWRTLEDKGISQYSLVKKHGFSSGQMDRLRKNMHVSTHTIEMLCQILDCNPEDIMEFKRE